MAPRNTAVKKRKKRSRFKSPGVFWTVKDLYEEVSVEQIELIKEKARKGELILDIAREIFNDNALVAGDLETKFVTMVLADASIEHNTAKKTIIRKELTEEEKDYIKNNYRREPSAYKLANLLFSDAIGGVKLSPNSELVGLVSEELKRIDENWESEFVGSKFEPPTTIINMAPFIRKALYIPFNPNELSSNDKKRTQALIKFINFPRFIATANEYNLVEERNLFIDSFISSCWDKPDLEPDDLNIVISLCETYIKIKRTSSMEEQLSTRMKSLVDTDEDNKISISLTQAIKEQHTISKDLKEQQLKLTTALNGTRDKRKELFLKSSKSIASIVEQMQEESSRREMVEMAEKSKEVLGDTIDRFTDMERHMAAIWGISKEDILGSD